MLRAPNCWEILWEILWEIKLYLCNKISQDLLYDVSSREYDEYISNVDIQTEFVDGKSYHQRVKYKFSAYKYEGIENIEIKGATVMAPQGHQTHF
eukprot:gene24401-10006_t